MILNGFICLFIILLRMYPNAKVFKPLSRLASVQSNLISQAQKNQAREKIITVLIMQFTLGIPWVCFDFFAKSFWILGCSIFDSVFSKSNCLALHFYFYYWNSRNCSTTTFPIQKISSLSKTTSHYNIWYLYWSHEYKKCSRAKVWKSLWSR